MSGQKVEAVETRCQEGIGRFFGRPRSPLLPSAGGLLYVLAPNPRLAALRVTSGQPIAGHAFTEVYGVPASFYIADCELGRGLFASRTIRAGENILRFRGRRFDRDDPIHQTEAAALLLQTGMRTYILAESPSVYVNHACVPNSGLVENRRLVALRDILAEEQITFDYSTTMDDGLWSLECRCGHRECRGTVKDFKHLPRRVQEHYLDLGVVQGFIARRYRRRPEAPGAYADAATA